MKVEKAFRGTFRFFGQVVYAEYSLRIRDMILSEKWDLGKNTVLCIWLCNLHTAEYLLVIHLHSDKWISFLVTCAYKLITAPSESTIGLFFSVVLHEAKPVSQPDKDLSLTCVVW